MLLVQIMNGVIDSYTVVELLTHNPQTEGLNPAAGTIREKMAKISIF
jgi:hypothetical protein